uniref:Uncharacterized protein n=1 Tax=Ficus carica TaxID=3494 RepID=A0AA87YWU7_FICCA|nr:hypothetical protein TIFTF001_051395 [Ficus carica]GMN24847.1 hypothetical protein TIFTF001_051396 [Ficus carica]
MHLRPHPIVGPILLLVCAHSEVAVCLGRVS